MCATHCLKRPLEFQQHGLHRRHVLDHVPVNHRVHQHRTLLLGWEAGPSRRA